MGLLLIGGSLALGSAAAMVLARNAVHSALLLVVNLLSVAVLFLSLNAEFLFVAQIIVYAGAIVVLFLFVIMLLGVDRAEVLTDPPRLQRWQATAGILAIIPIAFAVAGLLVGQGLGVADTPTGPPPEGFGSAVEIGKTLFTGYMLPFEVTSLLLLVAALGILMLARRSD